MKYTLLVRVQIHDDGVNITPARLLREHHQHLINQTVHVLNKDEPADFIETLDFDTDEALP